MANNYATLHNCHSVSIYSVAWLPTKIRFLTNGDFPDLLIYMVAMYVVFFLKVLHEEVFPLAASTTHHTSNADYTDLTVKSKLLWNLYQTWAVRK